MSQTDAAAVQTWIITIAPDGSLPAITKALEHIGFTIVRAMDAIGVVEARGTEALAAKARTIPGVADVSKELTFDVGPPDTQIA
jgi:hypothetical protein